MVLQYEIRGYINIKLIEYIECGICDTFTHNVHPCNIYAKYMMNITLNIPQ